MKSGGAWNGASWHTSRQMKRIFPPIKPGGTVPPCTTRAPHGGVPPCRRVFVRRRKLEKRSEQKCAASIYLNARIISSLIKRTQVIVKKIMFPASSYISGHTLLPHPERLNWYKKRGKCLCLVFTKPITTSSLYSSPWRRYIHKFTLLFIKILLPSNNQIGPSIPRLLCALPCMSYIDLVRDHLFLPFLQLIIYQ